VKPRLFAVLLLVALGGFPGHARPQAAPSATPSAGPAPLRVSFAPNIADGALYQWKFNHVAGAPFAPDFSTDVPEDVSYTYQAPGAYTALLRIYDALTGVPTDHDLPITVLPPPVPPVVTLVHSPDPTGVGTVAFTAGALASPGRTVVNYFWDLNADGVVDAQSPGGPGAAAVRVFEELGTFPVSVTAVDDLGLAGSAATTVRVSVPIQVSLAGPDPVLAPPGVAVDFVATGQKSASDPFAFTSFDWVFGDGAVASSPGPPGTANVLHAYAATGTYAATVTLSNEANRTAAASRTVRVENAPFLLASARSLNTTDTVELRAQFLPPAGATTATYLWDFGDGSTPQASPPGLGTSIVYVYPDSGLYDVVVTATDDLGGVHVGAVQADPELETGASVMIPPPPVTLLPFPTQVDGGFGNTARVGHRFVFGVTSQSIVGSTGPYGQILWDFDGDGVRDLVSVLAGDTLQDTFVGWQYPLPGTYSVKARAFLIGTAAFDEVEFGVTVLPPTAPLECWLVQPRDGARVWGNRVTLTAKAAPAVLTSRIDFEVRPEGSLGPWTPVGAALPPPYSALSAPWNASAFPPGRYELRARATDTSAGTALSTDLHSVIVEVDPLLPGTSESVGPDGTYREEVIDPDGTTRSELAQDTALDFPPYAFGTRTRIRIERPFSNPHPLEARLQGLDFVPGSFRRLSLLGLEKLQQPSRISLYSLNPDGVLDGLGLDPSKLSIWQFDDTAGRWTPLYAQVVQPGEDLIRATLSAMGDVGIVAARLPRTDDGGSDPVCGALGPELLLLPVLLLRRRRRR
jgi:PKD repeat protein